MFALAVKHCGGHSCRWRHRDAWQAGGVPQRGMVPLLNSRSCWMRSVVRNTCPPHQAVQHCCCLMTRAVATVAGRVPCTDEGTRTRIGPGRGPAAEMAGDAPHAEMTGTGAMSHRAAGTAGGAPRAEGSGLASISLPSRASGAAHLQPQRCLTPCGCPGQGPGLSGQQACKPERSRGAVSSTADRLILQVCHCQARKQRADQQLQA